MPSGHTDTISDAHLVMLRQLVRDEIAATPAAPDPVTAADSMPSAMKRALTLISVASSVGPIIIGAMVWFFNTAGDSRQAEIEAKAEAEAVSASRAALATHTDEMNTRVDKLEAAVVTNRVLMVDAVDMLGDKLDRIDSAGENVPEPASLTAAREAAKADAAREALQLTVSPP